MKALKEIVAGCANCEICVKECAFLQKYGTPGSICTNQLTGIDFDSGIVFECNLCSLCTSVCPKGLKVSDVFLQLRRKLQNGNKHSLAINSIYKEHKPICSYEGHGGSQLFSLHQLPAGCDTIFFPGCTLTATRSKTTLKTYNYLQSKIPALGIVLDCCSKPSHDLGLTDRFSNSLTKICDSLRERNIQTIYTACPSCYVTFANHARYFTVCSIYDKLAETPPHMKESFKEILTVHDACMTRMEEGIQDSVRSLVHMTGATIEESPHDRERAICCGEGAAASLMAPELTGNWKEIRQKEANGNRIITYCAGCSSTLGEKLPTTHLLDVLFNGEDALQGKEQQSRPPFTYLNRLLLKKRLIRDSGPGSKQGGARSTGKIIRNFRTGLGVAAIFVVMGFFIRISGLV